MAVYEDREAFIPYRRSDIVELCIEDGKLADAEIETFREFCKILSAYYHFQFHQHLENLKDNFAPFNPDAETKTRLEFTESRRAEKANQLVATFRTILEKANYIPISQDGLERALAEKSLIDLKTDVDFDEFDHLVCYCRGDIYQMNWVKKFFFRKVAEPLDIFERVVILVKFKDADYFTSRKQSLEDLNFIPGKMYVYIYKNIPKFDLELLFPNVKVSMTWKDRLLFGIPAIGAAVPIVLRILPQLLLIIGVILFFIGTPPPPELEELHASEEEIRNIMPVLLAILSLAITLGGFAFKQYTGYKNKLIKFQKKVTETLFYRNLASKSGVFQYLIDAAEEEECKEIILVYYHLLTSEYPLTPERLDDRIEEWMDEKFGTKIDFDINKPLDNLEAICGKLIKEGGDEATTPEVPLLSYDRQGCCQVLSLEDSKTVIDYVWDNLFLYANGI